MALAALATVADLAQRGVTVEVGENDIAGVYLGVASAAVRDAAGVPISQITSTVTVEGVRSQWLRLPGPPITAVASVTLDGVVITDWRLRSSILWRELGWSPDTEPSTVTVTYTHGLPELPADIVDLVCRLATAALVALRSGAAGEGLAATGTIRQESLGDYSVTYGADGRVSEMELPDHLRERLAARFGGGVAVVGSR